MSSRPPGHALPHSTSKRHGQKIRLTLTALFTAVLPALGMTRSLQRAVVGETLSGPSVSTGLGIGTLQGYPGMCVKLTSAAYSTYVAQCQHSLVRELRQHTAPERVGPKTLCARQTWVPFPVHWRTTAYEILFTQPVRYTSHFPCEELRSYAV